MWINKFFFILPVIVCIAVLGTAQTLPSQPIPEQDEADCLSSLEAIPDCVPEIFRSIINGQIGNVGPSCCHAFLRIDEECATQMFIFAPFFPPTLRDHCSQD
ncbi:hypothetical protein EUTSA_v10005180mg [Eutrema salsugineum]|uniref:Prolamin-like domain-containing protein n=1 Tax=Eutrema salsugineum TaxID=72664 RepID=V4KMK9_EUTSA|nr:uncharacterized protein LOC18012661 [Eutrema salsugineum]ESQ32494.1 hypothetical protein EUTSA_v10005180mg [Eutrema salsugineum]